jgi:hypothetical protein
VPVGGPPPRRTCPARPAGRPPLPAAAAAGALIATADSATAATPQPTPAVHHSCRQHIDPWVAGQIAQFDPAAAHRLAVYDPWVKGQLQQFTNQGW